MLGLPRKALKMPSFKKRRHNSSAGRKVNEGVLPAKFSYGLFAMCLKYADLKFLFRKALSKPPPPPANTHTI